MRIISSEPMKYNKKRVQVPLRPEDINDENAYDDIWYPIDDNPGTDVFRLWQQKRLSR